jgi:pyruvate kinase
VRKTKIVATLGPATSDYDTIKAMIEKGVDLFRLNFSHGDHAMHLNNIRLIRQAEEALSATVGILQDISGPKIRIGEVDGILELKRGERIKLCKEEDRADPYALALTYPQIIDMVKLDEEIYFADGTLRTKVVQKEDDHLTLELLTDGKLTSKKGVNFPHTKLDIPVITQKDEKDILFGAQNGVDLVALSFVQKADDVHHARALLTAAGAAPLLISKIETNFAIANLDEILEASDGLMVARGDLGAELGVSLVPSLQKRIIQKANEHAKPVITATQMLISMVKSPYPTRAEVSDVANALHDGSDAVMLSDETTIGDFPLQAIDVLHETLIDAEKHYKYHRQYCPTLDDSIASAAAALSSNIGSDAIVIFTTSGFSAKAISKYRPNAPIYSVTHSKSTSRQLTVVWGVHPLFEIGYNESTSLLIYDFLNLTKVQCPELVTEKVNLLITMGCAVGRPGSTSLIRIVDNEAIEKIEKRCGDHCE